jgi:hypothetical protein
VFVVQFRKQAWLVSTSEKSVGWQNSPKTPSELINGRLIVGDSLIIHTPTTTNELKLTIVDQFLDLVTYSVMLFHPPLPPECCLHINEPDIKKLLLSDL